MPSSATSTIANSLIAEVESRSRQAPLRHKGKVLPLDLAYDVQKLFNRHFGGPSSDTPGGYKIGLTNHAMQVFCGVDQPVLGKIFTDRIVTAPATVETSHYVRLGIESELAIHLAEAPKPNMTPAELLGTIDMIAAAFELVEDRGADYQTLDAPSIIAENSWNMGLVLGKPVAPGSFGALDALTGVLEVNGIEIERGSSHDIMDGPLNVIQWLAGFADTLGYRLKTGQWILTGAIVPTKFANQGDDFYFSLAGLPPVTLAIR